METNIKQITKTYYVATPVAKKRFRNWLIENDLTYRQFAKKCNCSVSYISAVMSGKKHITKLAIAKFRKGGYELL